MITSLSQIVKGTIFMSASGAYFEAVSTPVSDLSGILRVSISPVRQIGSSSVMLLAVVTEGSAYFTASNASRSGQIAFISPPLSQSVIVSAFAVDEVDLSNIPYRMADGAYELSDGGRVLIRGSAIFLGRRGSIQDLELINGLLTDPDNPETPINIGGTRACNSMVVPLNKVSEIAECSAFVSFHDGAWRKFKRRSHGIEAVDDGPHVPMSGLTNECYVLTTSNLPRAFAVGDRVRAGSVSQNRASFAGVVISISGNAIEVYTTDGILRSASYSTTPNLPASSEFSTKTASWNGLRLTWTTEDFVVPEPLEELPRTGNVVKLKIDNDTCTCVVSEDRVSSSGDHDLRLRRVEPRNLSGFSRTYLHYHGAEYSFSISRKDGKFYGFPTWTKVEDTYHFSEEPIEGALYLRADGTVVQAIASIPDEDGETEGSISAHVIHSSLSSPELYPWMDEPSTRFTILAKLADPGQWSLEMQAGPSAEAIMGVPEGYQVVSGVGMPFVDAASLNRIRAHVPGDCAACGAWLSAAYASACAMNPADETVRSMVCHRCAAGLHQCAGCGLRAAHEFANPFNVCQACHAATNFEVIHDYSYRPRPKMHGDGPLYFGVEVELVFDGGHGGRRKSTARDAIEISKGLLYAKRDGSIGEGIEFVTHPFSLPWLQENEETLQALFTRLSENMREDECCGIHIHTSKDGFEVNPSTLPNGEKLTKKRCISRGLMRVQRFVYGNPELVIHFAGRESSYACLDVEDTGRASSPIRRRSSRGEATPVSEMIRLAEYPDQRKENRYAAVNMTEKTVEFRVFKSTTDYDEFKRNILFIDSVIQYCRSHALPKNGEVGIKAYRRFLAGQGLYQPVLTHLDAFTAVARQAASF